MSFGVAICAPSTRLSALGISANIVHVDRCSSPVVVVVVVVVVVDTERVTAGRGVALPSASAADGGDG
jgi:hypothetical protein